MTNEQILTKAIEKAMKGGWDAPERNNTDWEVTTWGEGSISLEYGDSYGMLELSLFDIIFSHSFAKAIWGEEDFTDGKTVFANFKAWRWHLQQMVIKEEPLKYLERFLDEK